LFDLDPEAPLMSRMEGVAGWMAIWWICEVVPLAVTALLPIILFPLLGIMDGKDVAPIYFNHVIFLFIGGFLVALAMQKWQLHRRLAIKILILFGSKPQNILLGFMVSTAFLSMWISNTATTMMMVPIAFSIIIKLEELIEKERLKKYTVGVFLGIAYSASIGGVSTLVGTPPNLSFARILMILFPNAPEITFTTWMMYALPISIIFLFIVWLIIKTFFAVEGAAALDPELLKKEYAQLGRSSYEEKIVMISFTALAMLWIFRLDISAGNWVIPGWSRLLNYPTYINDGTVAIFIAVLLFVIPSKNGSQKILDWKTASNLPWHIVLLFGGGFAIASGFKETGLANWLGSQFQIFGSWSPILIIFCLCLFVTFLTELTSNTATAEILLPIIGGLAVAINMNPLILMIPTTVSCSFAFMLPVATPPNAIIFGTGRLKISDMARVGLWINILGATIISLSMLLLAEQVFNMDTMSAPQWAIP